MLSLSPDFFFNQKANYFITIQIIEITSVFCLSR